MSKTFDLLSVRMICKCKTFSVWWTFYQYKTTKITKFFLKILSFGLTIPNYCQSCVFFISLWLKDSQFRHDWTFPTVWSWMKILDFDSEFKECCSKKPNWRLFSHGPGNGLLPPDSKPLSKPLLTIQVLLSHIWHQKGSVSSVYEFTI